MREEPAYIRRRSHRWFGWSTSAVRGPCCIVPMLKEDELIGAIAIYRQEVRPFTDKQIELVSELRQASRHRHREHAPARTNLRESLEQQTATSEVLQVISSSPGELEPVFQDDAGERDTRLRGQVWHHAASRWKARFRHVALYNAAARLC